MCKHIEHNHSNTFTTTLSTALRHMLISSSFADTFQGDALQNELQLLMGDGYACLFIITAEGQFIGASFQAFMIQGKAISFKQQQLDLITFSVEEDKHSTAQRIVVHLSSNDTTKAVKPFTHVRSARVQVIAAGS